VYKKGLQGTNSRILGPSSRNCSGSCGKLTTLQWLQVRTSKIPLGVVWVKRCRDPADGMGTLT
jgi:hypothetical protein